MRKCLAIAGTIVVAWAVSAGSLAAQTLEKIKQRGVLVVGSKADYKPFGFRDPTGAIVGFEPDIAKRRRRQARREARDRAGRLVEPHAVPAAGQDRPDDRHHERQAGPPADRRHHRAALLRLRRQRARQQEGRAEDTGSSSRTRRSAASRAPGTTSRWPRNTAPTSWRSRARPRPRSRCSRAIASAGSMTTRRSPSASPIRNGRASR